MKVLREDGIFVQCDSILESLEIARIFSIKKIEAGKFYIEEQCDGAFGVFLDEDQMMMLIDELRAIISGKCYSEDE